jgi:hypothetical protein
MNQVGSMLLKRVNPLTTDEIAEKTGLARKTVQNSLTSSRVWNWLPEGQAVVVLHDTKNNTRKYCVRSVSDAENSESIRYRGADYSYSGVTPNGGYRFSRD